MTKSISTNEGRSSNAASETETHVYHREFSKGLQSIEAAFKDALQFTEAKDRNPALMPKITTLLGQSGAGKSTLIRDLTARFPEYRDETGLKQPIVIAEMPTNGKSLQVVLKIAEAMKVKIKSRMTTESVIELIEANARARGVVLVIIDEVQTCIDRNGDGKKVAFDVADLFKSLINRRFCSFLLVGLPTASKLWHANEQLARRIGNICEMKPYDPSRQSDLGEIVSIISQVERNASIEFRASLTAEVHLESIIELTRGRYGMIHNLVRHAVDHALLFGRKVVELEDVEHSIDTLISAFDLAQKNPFSNSHPNGRSPAAKTTGEVIQGVRGKLKEKGSRPSRQRAKSTKATTNALSMVSGR